MPKAVRRRITSNRKWSSRERHGRLVRTLPARTFFQNRRSNECDKLNLNCPSHLWCISFQSHCYVMQSWALCEWLALLPHCKKVLGSIPGLNRRALICGVCMFPLGAPGSPTTKNRTTPGHWKWDLDLDLNGTYLLNEKILWKKTLIWY